MCCLGLLVLYLLAGAWYLVGELGTVPAYGDTTEYLALATVLRVDHYRGILYPLFLAGMNQLLGHHLLAGYHMEAMRGAATPQARPVGAIWVQVVQLLLFGSALVYALKSALPSNVHRRQTLLLAAIIFFDPILIHLNLSLLTDGPCLALLLLLAGGLASRLKRRGRAWIAWAAIGIGGLGSSLLRPEKPYVVALVLLLVAAMGLAPKLRLSLRLDRKKALSLVAAALVIGLGSQAVTRSRYAPSTRWPPRISWLHERVIRPHLDVIRPSLPPELRRQFIPARVKTYDASTLGATRIMDGLSKGSPRRLEEMTQEMVDATLHHHLGTLVAEVVRDGFENVLITPAFYFHVLTSITDRVPSIWSHRDDANVWTYEQMTHHHPLRGRVALLVAGLGGLGAALYSLLLGLRTWRRGGRPGPELMAGLSPFLLLWLVNAAAFTAASALVHIRYGLIAHLSLLGLLWAPIVFALLPVRVVQGGDRSTA